MSVIFENRKLRFFLIFSLAIFGLTIPTPTTAFAVETNSGSTLQVTLPSSFSVTGNTIELTTLDTSVSRPATGWSDSDHVALNISITNSSDDTATVITTAGCVVDVSSSVNSGVYGTKQNQEVTLTGGSGSVFIIEDSSTAVTVTGQIQYVAQAVSFVQIRCPSSDDLTGKRIRVGIVPTMSASGSDYGPLYYLFSTNHYYRYATIPNTVTVTDNSNNMSQKWNWAKGDSITVDGRSKNVTANERRKGWVATLNTRDEIVLTNAMNTTGAPMIGTTDARQSWIYDSSGWGGTGDTITISSEGDFRWLGPDAWNQSVPSWNATNNGVTGVRTGVGTTTSRYWKRVNGVWQTGTANDHEIDFNDCDTNTTESSINGYGLAHAWHMESGNPWCSSGFRPTEPNDSPSNSGSYIYQGYTTTGAGVAGWDDAAPGGRNLYVEYCSPSNPCTPPDAAVASILISTGVSSCADAGFLENGSFENATNATNDLKGGAYYRSPATGSGTILPTGWKTTALATSGGDAVIETWRDLTESATAINMSGPDSAFSLDGSVVAEIAADDGGGSNQGLYQDVNTLINARVFWSYKHANRSGGADPQIAVFEAAPTPNSIPTVAIWTQAEQNAPFGSGVTPYSRSHSAASNSGWTIDSGTITPSTSRTRFLFRSTSATAQNVGNLIDDVRFTTYSACPITFTLVAGRTANLLVANNEQSANNFRYYGPEGASLESLSGVPSGLSASIRSRSDTGSVVSLTSSTVGTYSAVYRVQYTFGGTTYFTSSTITIQVVADIDCSTAGQLVNGDFESLPSGITEASSNNNNANNGTWHGYNGQKYSEPRQILFLTDQTDNSTNNFKLPGWSTNNNSNTHRVEIQRFRTGYGPQSTQSGGNTFDNTGPDAANGDYFAEINAENLGTLYQDVRVIPGSTLRWRMYHRGRAISGVDEMKVRIGPASAALSSFYTVGTTTYDNSPARRPSNSGSGASMQDARGSTSLMGGPKSTTDSQTVGGTTGGWGYYEGSYTVGASETTTRFAFVSISVSSGNNSVGNLIDAINFSPLVACPASFTVVAGKTTLINPFDLNLNGNTARLDTTDSLGWDNAFVSETISVTSGSATRTAYGGVTNRGINYTAPTTTGTYQMDFTLTNSFGDTSTSAYMITVVPDTGSRAPGGIPIDPRVTSYNLKLPQVTSTTGQVMACLQETNSAGDTITGTVRFDLGTFGSSQETITVLSDTVTITGDFSNYLRASGPINSVNKALESLRLTRTSNSRFKTYLYVRFSSVVTGLSVANPTDCSSAANAAIRNITLRPMTLVEVRRKVITPKNGRS